MGIAVDPSHVFWSTNGEVPLNPGNDLYRYDRRNARHLSDLGSTKRTPTGPKCRGCGASPKTAPRSTSSPTATSTGQGRRATGDCQGTPEPEAGGTATSTLAKAARSASSRSWTRAGGVRPTPPTGCRRTRASAAPASRRRRGSAPTGRPCSSAPSASSPPTTTKANRSSTATGPAKPECRLRLLQPDRHGAKRGGEPRPSWDDDQHARLWRGRRAPAALAVLSADGDRVFLRVDRQAVAADTNGDQGCPDVGSQVQGYSACQDVYEWEAQGAGSCERPGGGCYYLLSTGKGSEPAFLLDASASGNDVFIFTRSALVRPGPGRTRRRL